LRDKKQAWEDKRNGEPRQNPIALRKPDSNPAAESNTINADIELYSAGERIAFAPRESRRASIYNMSSFKRGAMFASAAINIQQLMSFVPMVETMWAKYGAECINTSMSLIALCAVSLWGLPRDCACCIMRADFSFGRLFKFMLAA
jgi:hypothetical protein